MKSRMIATIVLSAFVAASVIYLIASEVRNPAKTGTAATESDRDAQGGTGNGRVVTVYYFHTTYRCPTCMRIEALTESAVKANFSAELAAQRMIWKPLNIELDEYRHFADDFKLFTKSVIVVDSENGKQIRWKNLDRIWQLVRNEPAFMEYIKTEVNDYLKNI